MLDSHLLILPMFFHVICSALLYAILTLARASKVWGIGLSDFWGHLEPRVSANLSNQFEWPVLFYMICLLQISTSSSINAIQVWLAWLFIVGRVAHSIIQILTMNIRLRGIIFTVNFLAVLIMWILYCLKYVNI